MTRKKEATKPLFEVKADFEASLKHFLDEFMVFYQTVGTAIELKLLDARVAEKIVELHARVGKAMMSDD